MWEILGKTWEILVKMWEILVKRFYNLLCANKLQGIFFTIYIIYII